jgi:hypothetical protein
VAGMAPSWRKSSASANGDCVEVTLWDSAVLVRDSKKRNTGILEFTYSEWEAFLSGARSGEFDLEALRSNHIP